MTDAHRKTLEKYAAGELPLNRSIRAAPAEVDELRRRLAEMERRVVLARSQPESPEQARRMR